MARDTNVGLHLLDKAARGRTADGLAADNPIALRRERRRMTDHKEGALITNRSVAGSQRGIDLVLGELARRMERREIRTAAAHDRDPIDDQALAVQRDTFPLQPREDLFAI